mmetsp:Transcript_14924/g.32083  ORF Transcript_14924/g.32083 Transcript_14924/m.32083 type:complete len:363 (+) Transcript_14924:65-1153(+)
MAIMLVPPSPSHPKNPFKPASENSDWKRMCLAMLLILVPAIGYCILGSEATKLIKKHVVSKIELPHRPVTAAQAERMAKHILTSNPESIRPIHVGDKGRSMVHNIFWLHIQKCGTSLFNTLWLHFCPRVLEKNPTLSDRTDLIEYSLIKDYPMMEWCTDPSDVKFYNYPRVGFHWPYKDVHWGIKKGKRGDGKGPQQEEFHSFAMFRDPVERVKSAFSFRETTMMDVPHYSQLQDPDISIEDYFAEPHIPNCQIKMLLGHRCHHYVEPSELDVNLALQRISSPSFYFGLTDRWDESICLFHSWYGGEMKPFELLNNRPSKRLEISGEDEIEITDIDTAFVAGATIIFEERLKAAGCLSSDET